MFAGLRADPSKETVKASLNLFPITRICWVRINWEEKRMTNFIINWANRIFAIYTTLLAVRSTWAIVTAALKKKNSSISKIRLFTENWPWYSSEQRDWHSSVSQSNRHWLYSTLQSESHSSCNSESGQFSSLISVISPFRFFTLHSTRKTPSKKSKILRNLILDI